MKIFVSLYCIKEIGGISTAAYNLLHEISDKYDVTLCVLSNYIGSNFTLPKQVKLVKGSDKLGLSTIGRNLQNNQSFIKKLIRNYYRFLRRYGKDRFIYYCLNSIKVEEDFDVALAFTDLGFSTPNGFEHYDYYFILNHIKAKRKIAWIHNNPQKLGYGHDDSIGRFKQFDGIVNVSYDCKKIFDSIVPEFVARSYVVYNMYNISEIKRKALEYDVPKDNNIVRFLTVARVSNKQKRIDRIVNVCHKLTVEGYKDFEWIIVGDGPDRQKLQEVVNRENIGDVVKFVGLQRNPYPYMLSSDAFVLTSLYEGLPMTVREAQILGCPTLTTSFGAASEAVVHKANGEICENSEEGIFDMVKSILDNPKRLNDYRNNLKAHPVSNHLALEQLNSVLTGNKYV